MPDASAAQRLLADLDADYEIVRELGRGGTAVVYLAVDRALHREVAIKVIQPQFAADAEAVARFAREARTVAQLEHPNIVTIYAVRRLSDPNVALVMQYVPGETVKEALQREGAFSPERADRVLRDVAAALAYAHGRGIVHRDVKPENVFLHERAGRALLSDFGIARPIHGESHVTMANVAIGTPAYMSPEQVDGTPLDGRSDIYSLGLVGWEMLSGRRPWQGEALYNVIYRQKHEDLAPLDVLRPDVPPHLLAAIHGALAKDRRERWARAEDFVAALDGHAPPLAPRTPTPRPLARVVEDAPLAAAAAALPPATANAPTIRWSRTPAAAPRVEPRVQEALPGRTGPGARRQERNAERTRRLVPVAAVFALLVLGVVAALAPWTAWTAQLRAALTAPRTGPAVARPRSATAVTPPPSTPAAAPGDGGSARAGTDSTAASTPPVVGGDTALRADSVVAALPGDGAAPRADSVPPPSSPDSAAVPPRRLAAAALAPGGAHTCQLTRGGVGLCWGDNSRGQLGDGTTENRVAPTPILGRLRFTAIAAGLDHSCAVARGGAAYCWGRNDHGQLGDGTFTGRTAPARVAGESDFVIVQTGASHSCGLTAGGSAYCWGANSHGQLGDGSDVDRSRPAPVSARVRLTALAVGGNHSCALGADRLAYCWGQNSAGQLGDGSGEDSAKPSPVAAGFRFVSVTAGSAHSCALTPDGVAYCWGRNDHGQLGDGTTENRGTPVRVRWRERLAGLRASGTHTCAVTAATRATICWGDNGDGQLGDGTLEDRARPVIVGRAGG